MMNISVISVIVALIAIALVVLIWAKAKASTLVKTLFSMIILLVAVSYLVQGRSGVSYIGLLDLPINYIESYYYFYDVVLLALFVGGFYELLENTEAYQKIQTTLGNIKHKKVALVVTTVLFAILSSVTGINFGLLVIIPFGVSLVLGLGYDIITALLATLGASAVGLMGSVFLTYRDPASYYSVSYTNIATTVGLKSAMSNLVPTLILLAVYTLLLIFVILKRNKNVDSKNNVSKDAKKSIIKIDVEDDEDEEELYDEDEEEIIEEKPAKQVKKTNQNSKSNKNSKNNNQKSNKQTSSKTTSNKQTSRNTNSKNTSKKSQNSKNNKSKNLSAAKQKDVLTIKKHKKTRTIPLIIVFALMLISIILGFVNWSTLFGITVFDDFNTWLSGLQIGEDYAIITNLTSANIPAFGSWLGLGNYPMIILVIILATIIIKFVYKIPFETVFEHYKNGMKKMIPAISIAMLAYVLLICSYSNGFIETLITNASENPMIHGLIVLLGCVNYIDIYYISSSIFSNIVSNLSDNANLHLYATMLQNIYGLVQLFAPSSLLLIVCLSYYKVSYKDWLKAIWRFVLYLVIVLVIASVIIALL